MIKQTTTKICPHWDECIAPLCPRDKSTLRECSWYADEPICRLTDAPDWVVRQRLIAKTAKSVDGEYHFGDLI